MNGPIQHYAGGGQIKSGIKSGIKSVKGALERLLETTNPGARSQNLPVPVERAQGPLTQAGSGLPVAPGVDEFRDPSSFQPGSPAEQLENPGRRAFMRKAGTSALNQAIPSPLKAAAKFITDAPVSKAAKVAKVVEWPKGVISDLDLHPLARYELDPDMDSDAMGLADYLTELSAPMAAQLKKWGLYVDDDLNIHYDAKNFPKIQKLANDIFEEYNALDDAGQRPLWTKFELSGDDDVDYNSSYPSLVVDSLRNHLARTDPSFVDKLKEFRPDDLGYVRRNDYYDEELMDELGIDLNQFKEHPFFSEFEEGLDD